MKYFFLKAITILLPGMISYLSFAAPPKKSALIIGIGKYLPGTGWPVIHGDNDIDLVKHALVTIGFADDNIYTLKNEKADKAGIIAGFKQLLEKTEAGDMVVIHFSGHGQQLTDLNGDEPDGLDEAFVPYDAPATIKNENGSIYQGTKHLIDDELAIWFADFRTKIGPSGQLVVFMDACHSGTASRGNNISRGTMPPLILSKDHQQATSTTGVDGSGYIEPGAKDNMALSKFVMFAAARAEETNDEYKEKSIGSLSYAIADAMENKIKPSSASFRDLFEYIRNTMAIIVPAQNPQVEGDKDMQIFGGNIILQEAFYQVKGEEENGELEIIGGKILGVIEGTQVGMFPVGTRSSSGTPIVSGKVIRADYLRSYIKTDRKISADSAMKLQAFITVPVFNNSQIKVFIKKAPAGLVTKLKEGLTEKKISLGNDATDAMLVIDVNNNNDLEIKNASDGVSIVPPFDYTKDITTILCGGVESPPVDAVSSIITTITNYARNNVIKNTTFGDKHYELSISLTAINGNVDLPVFNTENSKAILRIENTATNAGYVYLVEFDPSGRVCPLMGFNTEIKLQPGQSSEVPVNRFRPPYGRYIIKGYITERQIGDELQWLITEQDAAPVAKGNSSQLITLLGELINNPGTSRSGDNKTGGASITNYSYDIKN